MSNAERIARRTGWGIALALLVLGCGQREAPPAGDGADAATSPAATATVQPVAGTGNRADSAATAEPVPADFSNCPDGGEPRELSLPATGTRMRWCERQGPGGARIQHGPWEKAQNGVVVERGGFREGARHGRWVLYWQGGDRQSEGDYRDGRRAGIWSSFREDGSLIRRHDYGDPAREAIEVASPEAVKGDHEVTLEIDNTRATPLVFKIEPFSQAWAIPAGRRFEVRSRGGTAHRIRVEADENGLTVWPDPGAETTLLADGVELQP